jgi:branched-chain amino acid aminotransferase
MTHQETSQNAAPITSEATDGPGYAYIDGTFCSISDARIPIIDWGFLRSDATYDVVKVTDRRLFRLSDHIARLKRGAEMLGYAIDESWDDVRAILAECVDRSGLETCVAYAIVTRGVPPLGMSRDPRAARNRLYAMALPVPWLIGPDDTERALSAGIGNRHRIASDSVDPTIKNFHWLDLVTSLRGAYADGHETTILLDADGNVTEGPGFNVFIVTNGTLVTAPRGVLLGITRRSVIEMAAERGIACEERAISLAELRSADEVFGTSSAGGVVPIGQVDGVAIGDRRPGAITRQIRDTLREWQHSDDHSIAVSDVDRTGLSIS